MGGGNPSFSNMTTLTTCRKLFSETKIFSSVSRLPFFNDEPQLYTYSAFLKEGAFPSDINGGGTSFSENIAYIKAIMEAVERYALIPTQKDIKNWERKSISSLEENSLLEFKSILKFSQKQLESKQFKKFSFKKSDTLKSCLVEDFLTGISLYFPAQFFYLPYWEKEKILRLPISTGAASGFSKTECIEKGILEIIERDQFMNSYHAKMPGEKILLKNIPTEINNLLEEYKFYKLKIHLIFLQSDIPVPTILTILEDTTNKGPLYTFGLKCSPDMKTCIRGSLEEAFHSRRWLRYEMEMKGKKYIKEKVKDTSKITEILDRGLTWSSQVVKGNVDFWIKNNNIKEIDLSNQNKTYNDLSDLKDILVKKKWHCFIKDFSPKELSKYNVYVYKVFIPEAHPLYLDQRYPYFDNSRIKEILVVDDFNNMNEFLQPFL